MKSKHNGNNGDFVELPVATVAGKFIARYSKKGLAELHFPNGCSEIPHGQSSGEVRVWHRKTEAALKKVLTGHAPLTLPPLDLSTGTEFQRSVWSELRKIHPGRTRSYGEIARAIGKPRAVRAVGGACGANPIPVLVPCHRVLAASRKIGGFSGGLEWKRALLAREGVTAS